MRYIQASKINRTQKGSQYHTREQYLDAIKSKSLAEKVDWPTCIGCIRLWSLLSSSNSLVVNPMVAPKNMANITNMIPLLAVQNDGHHEHKRVTKGDFRGEKVVDANGSMEQFSDSLVPPEFSVSDELLEPD